MCSQKNMDRAKPEDWLRVQWNQVAQMVVVELRGGLNQCATFGRRSEQRHNSVTCRGK